MTIPTVIAVLASMAAITYLTRASGVWALNAIETTPRLKNALDATTAAVLVAIIAPTAADGDAGSRLALTAAAVTMIATRRSLLAVTIGVITAATARTLT